MEWSRSGIRAEPASTPAQISRDFIPVSGLHACYISSLALDPFSSLQRFVFMSGRGFSYFAETPGLPLSLKCMFNGRALYRFGRAEVAVDDGGYLILNDRQPYSIEIASPTRVETPSLPAEILENQPACKAPL